MAPGAPSSSCHRERARNEIDLFGYNPATHNVIHGRLQYRGLTWARPRPTIDVAGGSKRGHSRSLWVSPDIKPWMS